jgi:hypothetical protein
MVHGAGHIEHADLSVGHRLAQHRGYLLIDHERPVYDLTPARTRQPAAAADAASGVAMVE